MKTLIAMMGSTALILLSGCGLSESEKTDVALVTCSIMGESRGMDRAVRVKEINNAREKLGEDVFVEGDKAIGEAFEYGLCQELVLNDKDYSSKLANKHQENAWRLLSNIDKAREEELSVIAEIQHAIHGFHTRMSFDQFEELARSLKARSVEILKVDDRTVFSAYFSACEEYDKEIKKMCRVYSEESGMKIGEIPVHHVTLNIDPAEIHSYLDTYKVPHRSIGINVNNKYSEQMLSFLTSILGLFDDIHTLDLGPVVIEQPYWKLSTDLDEIAISGGGRQLNLVRFDEVSGT